jgi:hypothetical protein
MRGLSSRAATPISDPAFRNHGHKFIKNLHCRRFSATVEVLFAGDIEIWISS